MQMSDQAFREFRGIQSAAEALLAQLASGEVQVDDRALALLENLASSGAKLAYSQGCLDLESAQMHNLIAWCDHLNESEWKSRFEAALRVSPLRSPW